jgi:hypothetical protein
MSKATTVISPNSHNIGRLMLDSVSSQSFYVPCDLYAIRNICREIESISDGIRDLEEGIDQLTVELDCLKDSLKHGKEK